MIIVFIAGAFWWISLPSWVQLLKPDVSERTFIEVSQHLMQWEVPYKEDPATNSILVQSADIVEVRSRLSKLGIPSESSPGLEIFNESEYGMSEFTQRVNFQRAIESELARTILSFPSISGARVHLSIPKESIFKDRTSLPKASVTIRVLDNKILSHGQITGIRELVASSVDRLEPKNVVVLNEDGTVYYSNNDTQVKNNLNQQNLENTYSEKAYNLVYEMVKTQEIQVAVNIQYNYDKVRSIKEEIIPNEQSKSGYLVKSSEQTTSSPLEKSVDKGNSGTDTIIEREWAFTKEKSEIEYSAGKIQRVSVGIAISKDLSPGMIQSIGDLISAGLGLDPDRGDKVVVVGAPPVEVEQEAIEKKTASTEIVIEPKPNSEASRMFGKIEYRTIALAAVGFSAVMVFLLLLLLARRRTTPKLTEKEREEFLESVQTWLSNPSVNRDV